MSTKTRSIRIRHKIRHHTNLPRLTVFRSNKFVYAQVIDDAKAHTVAAAKDKSAKIVGTRIAELALAAKVKQVVFDRSGYKYHGRIKQLAEAAREAGLKF